MTEELIPAILSEKALSYGWNSIEDEKAFMYFQNKK